MTDDEIFVTTYVPYAEYLSWDDAFYLAQIRDVQAAEELLFSLGVE